MTGNRQATTACKPALGESQRPTSVALPATRSQTSASRSNGAALASSQSRESTTQPTTQNALPDDVVEFIERAGIREYEGEMSRARAESAALQEISRMYDAIAAKRCDVWRRANP